MLAVLLALMSAVGFAVGNVYVRRSGSRDHEGGLIQSVCSQVLCLWVLFLVLLAYYPLGDVSIQALGWFVGAGALATFVGRHALYSTVRALGPSRASGLKNAAPLISVVLALALLGERIDHWDEVGIAVGGVGLLCLLREAFSSGRVATGVVEGNETPRKRSHGGENEQIVDGCVRSSVGLNGKVVPKEHSRGQGYRFGITIGMATAVIYGSAAIIRKEGLFSVHGIIGAAFGAALGSSTALVLALITDRIRSARRPVKNDRMPMSGNRWDGNYIGAGVGAFVGQSGGFMAIALAPVAKIAMVAPTEIVFTLVVGRLVLKNWDRIGVLSALGFGCVIGAVGCLVIGSGVR